MNSTPTTQPGPLTETAVLNERGKLSTEQNFRALSLAVRKSADMPAVRESFAQFDDLELVWLIHPEGKWAILARQSPAGIQRAKLARRAEYSMARDEAPFVRLGRPINNHG